MTSSKVLSVPSPTDPAAPRPIRSESRPFGDGTENIIGTIFEADALGYRYLWRITSNVLNDAGGRPFVWAEPLKRISGKRGRLRMDYPWHLSILPCPRRPE